MTGPIQIGRAQFDTNTLLVCSMATLVGLQLCFFGLFTRIFAIQAGLLPDAGLSNRFRRFFTLERGVGAALLVLAAESGASPR